LQVPPMIGDPVSLPPGSSPAGAPPEELAAEALRRGLLQQVLGELGALDRAAYQAVASTPTPHLDRPLRRLSDVANHSALWVGIAGGLATVGGDRGRRAASLGLVSVGIASAVANLGAKNLYARRRPARVSAGVPEERHASMPGSSSFPSGHSASAFAFATAVGHELPWLSLPLRVLAATVAYSRVHTGVHYPGDVVIGSVLGGAVGITVASVTSRRARRLV